MPTESQAAEAQRVLTEHVVQLDDIDNRIGALVVDRDQQVQSIVEETGLEIKRLHFVGEGGSPWTLTRVSGA